MNLSAEGELFQQAQLAGVGVLWSGHPDFPNELSCGHITNVLRGEMWACPHKSYANIIGYQGESEEDVIAAVNWLQIMAVSYGVTFVLRGGLVDYDHPSVMGCTGKIVNGELLICDHDIGAFHDKLRKELANLRGKFNKQLPEDELSSVWNEIILQQVNRIADFLKRSKSARR